MIDDVEQLPEGYMSEVEGTRKMRNRTHLIDHGEDRCRKHR
jgi:hypothetical protein